MSWQTPSRQTLRERFFPLHDAAEVDRFLEGFSWTLIFKAGTSDKTFEAWEVTQRALEPRQDVAVGFIRLPEDRPASDRVTERTTIEHRSPQAILFERGAVRFSLDEFAITPDQLVPRLREHLPVEVGPRVWNEAVVSLSPYRSLLQAFVAGELPQERFEWAYLDRLKKAADWRDDETFALLDTLFENPGGRAVEPARLVALEFQAQLAGRIEPLKARAARLLGRLTDRS
jgi:bacillithiol system protein YtxJ